MKPYDQGDGYEDDEKDQMTQGYEKIKKVGEVLKDEELHWRRKKIMNSTKGSSILLDEEVHFQMCSRLVRQISTHLKTTKVFI